MSRLFVQLLRIAIIDHCELDIINSLALILVHNFVADALYHLEYAVIPIKSEIILRTIFADISMFDPQSIFICSSGRCLQNLISAR